MKKFNKILALLIITLASNALFSMEWQGDYIPHQPEKWQGDPYLFNYPLVAKIIIEYGNRPQDEIEFLKVVEDNDEELAKQYIMSGKIKVGDIEEPSRAKKYSGSGAKKIRELSDVLIFARKIALKNKNYNLVKFIESLEYVY